MSKDRYCRAALLAVGIAAWPLAAIASHGKAGLWDITSTIDMGNMLSPAQTAQMRAMGMHMPTSNTVNAQRCMTAQEVATDNPPPPRSKNCSYSNVKVVGHTYSGDLICTGDFEGTGHFSITYDSDEHYTGTTTMTGTAHGHPVNSNNTIEGKWISADCGNVK